MGTVSPTTSLLPETLGVPEGRGRVLPGLRHVHVEGNGRAASRRGRSAGSFLAMGLALEIISTLWAFQEAVSAGALSETARCDDVNSLFESEIVQDTCEPLYVSDALSTYQAGCDKGSLSRVSPSGLRSNALAAATAS